MPKTCENLIKPCHLTPDLNFNQCRGACSIPLGDQLVLTGGGDTRTTVSRYGKDGWVKDMPSLNQGRYSHGCAAFMIGSERVRLTK